MITLLSFKIFFTTGLYAGFAGIIAGSILSVMLLYKISIDL